MVDLTGWKPEVAGETDDFVAVRMPPGVEQTPRGALATFQALSDLGYAPLTGGGTGVIICRKPADPEGPEEHF